MEHYLSSILATFWALFGDFFSAIGTGLMADSNMSKVDLLVIIIINIIIIIIVIIIIFIIIIIITITITIIIIIITS